MGVPAHVQLDAHAIHEWYEKEYITKLKNHIVCDDLLPFSGVDDVPTIMWALAAISDQFDSDGDWTIVDGVTEKVNAHDGWTDAEGRAIASECYVGAVAAAGKILVRFFDAVAPTVELLGPETGQIHSGLRAVDLSARVKHYDTTFASSLDHGIESVFFRYSTVDAPAPSDWVEIPLAARVTEDAMPRQSPDWSPIWYYVWKCQIDDALVHVEAIAFDGSGCRSTLWPQKEACHATISIDSTRPTVSNIHP